MFTKHGSHWVLGTAMALAAVYFASIAAAEVPPIGTDDDTIPSTPEDDGILYLPLTW